MNAWSSTGSAFARVETPPPRPTADQILVRVTAAAVGAAELAGGTARVVGEVIECGDNARHLDGARVALPDSDPCGECELCRRGAVALCVAPGGRGVDASIADVVCASARWACRVDGDLALDGAEAALLCRDAVLAYEAIARLGAGPGDPVLVVGSSALARLVVGVAHSRGALPFVFEPDARAVASGERGARVIEANTPLTEVAAAHDLRHRPWRVVDTAGTAQTRAQALALVHPGAHVALLAPAIAGTSVDAALSLAPALDAGATITALRGAHPDLAPEVAALVKKGELDLASAASVRPGAELDGLSSEAIAAAAAAGTTAVFAL